MVECSHGGVLSALMAECSHGGVLSWWSALMVECSHGGVLSWWSALMVECFIRRARHRGSGPRLGEYLSELYCQAQMQICMAWL
jgi:hypothetical protein